LQVLSRSRRPRVDVAGLSPAPALLAGDWRKPDHPLWPVVRIHLRAHPV